jgi:hypothetical protein
VLCLQSPPFNQSESYQKHNLKQKEAEFHNQFYIRRGRKPGWKKLKPKTREGTKSTLLVIKSWGENYQEKEFGGKRSGKVKENTKFWSQSFKRNYSQSWN